MRRWLSGVSAVAALLAVAGTAALSSPAPAAFETSDRPFTMLQRSATHQVSDNWAGYIVAAPGTTFSRVAGTWRQPRVSCDAGAGESASAFWVGLGGSRRTSLSLEQIGTGADCLRSGVARHYAWYELVPAPMVRIGLKIAAGDLITSSVKALGGVTVEVTIENRTSGKSFRKTLTAAPIDLSSAEWIAEAPSVCNRLRCYTMGLANFGTVAFSHAAVTGNGSSGAIRSDDWAAVAVDLNPRSDRAFVPGPDIHAGSLGALGSAFVSPVSVNGRAFTVTWSPPPET
jgi:hypothetical protein